MVKESRKKQQGNVLLEDIGRDIQRIAEGHKTLSQKMDRIEVGLSGEIRRLDEKVDLYMRELRKELVERADALAVRMDEGFGHIAAAMGDASKQLQEHSHTN